MNSVQISQKLEQFRREAAIQNALEEIRRQHFNTLKSAARTMLLELSALTIGSLELVGKPRVQKHV
jgi:hypothetical protein